MTEKEYPFPEPPPRPPARQLDSAQIGAGITLAVVAFLVGLALGAYSSREDRQDAPIPLPAPTVTVTVTPTTISINELLAILRSSGGRYR